MIENVKISQIKANPDNPRVIKDAKYQELYESMERFPDMINKKPLIVFTDKDKKLCILGGNQRFRVLQHLKVKSIPIIKADNWTEEQKKEFLIRDNISSGEWDWDILANIYEPEDLNNWGLSVPVFIEDNDEFGTEFELPEGEKEPFQQMTFVLADEQSEVIRNILSEAKNTEAFKYMETFGNENGNGNALYLILTEWERQKR